MMPFGFGCAYLHSGRERRRSLRLLEAAFEHGTVHFDTARMYARGEAESVLGEFARRRRDRLFLVSKAGILPAQRTLLRRVLEKSAVTARRLGPAIRNYVAEPQPATPRFGVFAPRELRASVETSLRELRTTYLDVLLLHECSPDDVTNPAVIAMLDALRQEGKIRAYGIATGIAETLAIMPTVPALTSVVQIPSDAWNANIERLPRAETRTTITHSVLAGRFRQLVARLRSDASLARKWGASLGVDATNASELARLFLALAVRANPEGIVLFSSSRVENIAACASVASGRPVDPAQIDGLIAALSQCEPDKGQPS